MPRISAVAAFMFLALAGGTFAAWSLARTDDRAHIQRMNHLTTIALVNDLTSDMDAWIRGQVRLAKLWEFQEPTHQQWVALAELYIEHHPGCLSIEWIDSKYEEQWTVRAGVVGPAQPASGELGIRERLLSRALQSGETTLSDVFTSSSTEKRWFTVVPIYQNRRFHGFVLATFDVETSLNSMLADITALPFSASLEEGGAEVYHLRSNDERYRRNWSEAAEAKFSGAVWHVHVWPTAGLMDEMQSKMPAAIVVFGALLTLLLPWILHANEHLRKVSVQRGQAEEAQRASQARFAGILEISADAVISTDANQRITLYNRAAETIFGYTAAEAIGQPVEMLIPERFRAVHQKHVARFASAAVQNMLMSERGLVFGLRKDGSEFPMIASISRLELGKEKIFTVVCSDATKQVRAAEELRRARDELELRVQERTADLEKSNQSLQLEISERKLAEEAVRVLSGRLMRVQDEQRRELARELHDGATQNLVAVALNLGHLARFSVQDAEARLKIAESLTLIEESTSELRTISYLLHPPLLEELGLLRTLGCYVDGFSKRSGIAVTFTAPEEDFGRVESQLELTVFRIVQEALSNIHRHSGSQTASVTLSCDDTNIKLEIADQGRGIPEGKVDMGVGIAAMRERVRLIRGELEIQTSPAGTIIRATLPQLEVEPDRAEDRPQIETLLLNNQQST